MRDGGTSIDDVAGVPIGDRPEVPTASPPDTTPVFVDGDGAGRDARADEEVAQIDGMIAETAARPRESHGTDSTA